MYGYLCSNGTICHWWWWWSPVWEEVFRTKEKGKQIFQLNTFCRQYVETEVNFRVSFRSSLPPPYYVLVCGRISNGCRNMPGNRYRSWLNRNEVILSPPSDGIDSWGIQCQGLLRGRMWERRATAFSVSCRSEERFPGPDNGRKIENCRTKQE